MSRMEMWTTRGICTPDEWFDPRKAHERAGRVLYPQRRIIVTLVRRPWAGREILEQIWFVARVSIFPTIMLSIPYTVLIVFVLNILLVEIGAGDLSVPARGWPR